MTISSGVGSSVAAILLSAWLYWAPEEGDYGSWVPATLVVIYVIFNSYGFFMVQGLMLGEMLPARARGPASGITCAIINALLFVTAKTFPWMSKVLQPHGLFLLFGLMTVAGTVFAHLFVPETKGRTLAEVEEHFSGPSLFWRGRPSTYVEDANLSNEAKPDCT
jgi:Sugar (and other) transporter